MNKSIRSNIIRFIAFLILQVLLFKNINLDQGLLSHAQLLVYPIVILLLPIDMLRSIAMLIAFFLGLGVDVFYDSPGVHASALVLIAFIRPNILNFFSPREGYKISSSPSLKNYGIEWFLPYAAILLFIHNFFYFSVEAFSFVYLTQILINTFFSFIFSFIVILFHQLIFRNTH